MPATLTMDLPEDVLQTARMTVDEARVELAISLFASQRLSMGKAAEFAGLPVAHFLGMLAARHIGPHYDREEALSDAATLARLRAAS